ncbi:MAG TPA: hypothetical protein V6D35_10525 [Candidatus Sericytochromatia bacterium]
MVIQALKCEIVVVLGWVISEQPEVKDASSDQIVAYHKKMVLKSTYFVELLQRYKGAKD